MGYKLLIYPPVPRYRIPSRQGWEVIYFPSSEWHFRVLASGESGAECPSDLERYPDDLVRFIREQDPDFVLVFCGGCTEARFDRTDWPEGPRYITWSIDYYCSSGRARRSDLHLTGLPTDEPTDRFLPLFQDPLPTRPWALRDVEFGIIYNSFSSIREATGGYRDDAIRRVKAVVPSLYTASRLKRSEYLSVISSFKFGLNVGQYPENSLPNFRNFELGAAGVMPVSLSDDRSRTLLESIFEDNILLYSEVDEIPDLLLERYDPERLRTFYAEGHSLQSRLGDLFRKYFDLEFPTVPLVL